jgi:signal transduction histidine kinase
MGNLDLHSWVAQGTRLGSVGRSVGWWIGDWLRYGNARFGERYVRAARITGYDTQTLMNMAYTASRVEISRRRENLSWSHHAEIAALEPEDQDRWLERAERERLSVRSLREELRRERRAATARSSAAAEPDPHDELVCPRCGCRITEMRHAA